MLTSPLHATHRALGARFIHWGGWEMPLNYGSVMAEHHAVREECGVFDVSCLNHVSVSGPDARSLLRRLLANDVDRLPSPGKALYTPLLNDQGGVLDDLIVHWQGEHHYRLVLDPARSAKSLAWITAHRNAWGLDARLTQLKDSAPATLAIQGPQARAQLSAALPALADALADSLATLPPFSGHQMGDYFLATTGYTGEDGVEITLPAPAAETLWRRLLAAGVKPCGLTVRDSLRLEVGLHCHGQDMDDTTSPLDTGLAPWVDLSRERDFVGREALTARPRQWQCLGLLLPGKGLLRDQQTVVTAYGEGRITSASYSPTLATYIALARLPLGVKVGDEAHANLRGRLLPVRVTGPRFVGRGRRGEELAGGSV